MLWINDRSPIAYSSSASSLPCTTLASWNHVATPRAGAHSRCEGNEEGTFPTQRAIAEGERSIELSEEKRLCYVAMTRAKTHLVLTWRREVSFFSGATFKTKDADRSRFLDILVSKQGATPGKGGTTPGAQAERRNRSLKNNVTGKSSVVGSMTKREIHTEASRLLASEDKSWGNWEPSSQKKMI